MYAFAREAAEYLRRGSHRRGDDIVGEACGLLEDKAVTFPFAGEYEGAGLCEDSPELFFVNDSAFELHFVAELRIGFQKTGKTNFEFRGGITDERDFPIPQVHTRKGTQKHFGVFLVSAEPSCRDYEFFFRDIPDSQALQQFFVEAVRHQDGLVSGVCDNPFIYFRPFATDHVGLFQTVEINPFLQLFPNDAALAEVKFTTIH